MSWAIKSGRKVVEMTRKAMAGNGPPRVTLGVRTAVFDGPKVLLVRHTYMPGWHMPGGGVDRGESAADAAVRELKEETWIEAQGAPRLVGFYYNPMPSKSDHIALYVCETWRSPRGLASPNMEIAEVNFFDLANLPDGTSRPTILRLAEISGAPFSHYWKQ